MSARRLLAAAIVFIVLFLATDGVEAQAALDYSPSAAVVNDSSYYDDNLSFTVVGEVQNNGDVPLKDVTVLIGIYDRNGSKLTTTTVKLLEPYLLLAVLEAGHRLPFRCRTFYSQNWETSAPYNYTIEGVTYLIAEGKPLKLQIIDDTTYVDQAGFLHVTGDVQNLGESHAYGAGVTATFRSSSDKVVAASHSTLSGGVPPNGGRAFFDLRIEDMDRGQIPQIQGYTLYASSFEYNMIPEFSSTVFVSVLCLISVNMASLFPSRFRRRTRSSSPDAIPCVDTRG
jgi:hypothetical protein